MSENGNPTGGKTDFSNNTDQVPPHRLSDDIPGSGAAENSVNKNPNTENSAVNVQLQELEKYKHDYLYLRAEFENFKKQSIKERSDLRKYGCERMAADLLGVLDIFETALSTEVNAETLANFRKGIEMTATELRNVLNRHGVNEVPAKGLPFDPALHEALSSEESAEAAPGTITQVFKKPYKLHDRVIRPGQVVVAKAKA